MGLSASDTRSGRYLRGVRDGMPICLGYLAVSFSLGITAGNVGLNVFQGFLASLLNNASAGEYAGFSLIAAGAAYLEMALVIIVTNARYLLMSAALSQKFAPDTPFYHRLLIGFDVTDEIFGLAVSQPGALDPPYLYGALSVAIPGWSVGTALGVAAGNVMPERVVGALSVAIFGMFLAIIIPPGRKDRVLMGLVLVSFTASLVFQAVPFLAAISAGTRTLILTVVIAGLAALLFPRKEETA